MTGGVDEPIHTSFGRGGTTLGTQRQVEKLRDMTAAELREKYQEAFGEETRSRNKHGALLCGLLWCASCGARMTTTY